jgi:hypothetical protein
MESLFEQPYTPWWNNILTKQTACVQRNIVTHSYKKQFPWKSSKYYLFWMCFCSPRYSTCTVLSSVTCLVIHIFQKYLINGTILEKMWLNIKCMFWFSLQPLSKTFLILRRNERDMIKKMYIGHVQYPLFLSGVLINLNFLDKFSKNTRISNFMKILSVGTDFFQCRLTDRRTDMTKQIVAFRNFFELA